MILDLFSKRQKRLRGDVPDVYAYNEIPDGLRVQIVHIWTDTLGGPDEYYDGYGSDGPREAYKMLVDLLSREYGVFALTDNSALRRRNYLEELADFFLGEQDIERVLDVIEISFRYIDKFTRDYGYLRRQNANERADSAIDELNARLGEHAVGYRYESGEIVRIDSEVIHREVVRPALRVLSAKGYEGAQQEFLCAHEHYRHGRPKESLNEALKALESTLKAVCAKRGWPAPKGATSRTLIDICLQNDLIPQFWQNSFGGLRALLEGGVPPSRNNLSGHGQGLEPSTVPDYIVAYVLHMTAAAIVFIGAAEQDTSS